LRAAAGAPERIVWTAHAMQRMQRRGILVTQVREVFRAGWLTEGPVFDVVHGSWGCRIEARVAGDNLAVAVAIMPPDGVIVITAFDTR
jgi:hypothetical protein